MLSRGCKAIVSGTAQKCDQKCVVFIRKTKERLDSADQMTRHGSFLTAAARCKFKPITATRLRGFFPPAPSVGASTRGSSSSSPSSPRRPPFSSFLLSTLTIGSVIAHFVHCYCYARYNRVIMARSWPLSLVLSLSLPLSWLATQGGASHDQKTDVSISFVSPLLVLLPTALSRSHRCESGQERKRDVRELAAKRSSARNEPAAKRCSTSALIT